MSYGLIYTVPFSTLDRVPCVVEIEKEGYSGKVTELTAGSSPFTVDIEDEEFLYTPTRFSTATIRIVGSDYLQSLFSIGYQQYRVTFKRDGDITWCGFIKPELYTQDYSSEIFELELECMSAMSVLEFIDYKQQGENREFVSLWSLLKKCISSANSHYTAIYIPNVYAKNKADYDTGVNVLETMTISEQNFFDEDDKPMKSKEVLEEICKFLNWTCVDWKGELYFVDIDHINEYNVYDINLMAKIKGQSINILNVQKIGFFGSDHSLDILNGYNKVTVKTSNYPVGNMGLDEDYTDLTIATTPADAVEYRRVSRKVIFLPNIIDMKQWRLASDKSHAESVPPEWVSINKKDANSLLGAMPIRFCEYELKDDGTPSITNYNYEDAIQVRWTAESFSQDTHSMVIGRSPVIIMRGPSAVYADGAFSIAGQMCTLIRGDMGVIARDLYWGYTPELKCRLRIGELWYDGTDWVKAISPIMPPEFSVSFSGLFSTSKWVSIKNTKTLNLPYDGLEGRVIEIGSPKVGDLEFAICGSYVGIHNSLHGDTCGMVLKGLKFQYKDMDFSNKKDGNSDRYYENIVNEDYINELDEIEFKISSYNNDGACYSKVMLGEDYLTDNLYSAIEETTVRPEEQLIRRIIKRYSATRIKLTQVIKATPELTPITRLSDNYMVNKKFINAGGTIDYAMNQFTCIMIEV